MVRLDYRCIFVHIPKTAGTSISNTLKALPPQETKLDFRAVRKLRSILPPSEKGPIAKHSNAMAIRASVGQYIWRRCYTFAIVRNPWDQMVSSYFWWIQRAHTHPSLTMHCNAVKAMGGFAGFMLSDYGRTMVNEIETNVIDYLTDENGSMIVSFVGRLENICDDWKEICDSIGIERAALPKLNVTQRKSYRDYYDDTTRQIVARRFAGLIDKYGYEF